MPDDPTIPDAAIVWRYVVGTWVVAGKDGQGSRPSSGAFEDSSDDPMSAVLASPNRDPATAMPERHRGTGAGVVLFEARFLRSLGLQLERDPQPDEPDHILVRGNKTRSLRRKLAENAKWALEGKRSSG
jgi:hypothetical protein